MYVYYSVNPCIQSPPPSRDATHRNVKSSNKFSRLNHKYHACRIAIIIRANNIFINFTIWSRNCLWNYLSKLSWANVRGHVSILLQNRSYDKTGIYFGENSFITFRSDFFPPFYRYFLPQTPKISFATKRREVDVFRLPEMADPGWKLFLFSSDAAGRKPCAQNESPFPIPRSIPRIVVTIWCFSPGGSVRPQNRATKDIRL